MKISESVSALAKELGVDRTVFYHWKNQSESGDEGDRAGQSPVRELRKEVRDLKRVLGEKGMEVEVDFFRGCAPQKFDPLCSFSHI